jgi:alanine dehydrogenase
VANNSALRAGVNTYQGQVTHPGVAESQGREIGSADRMLDVGC